MSKKHFEAIAAALVNQKPPISDEDFCEALMVQWQRDVLAMVGVCCMFNDNFDRSRFLSACDYDDGR